MFNPSFIPIIVASTTGGLLLGRKALLDPQMDAVFKSYLSSCTYGPNTPFRGLICILEPFFKDLVTNELGKGFLTAFGTTGSVMSLHLYLRAGQHGRSAFLSPILFTLNTLAGQVMGAGFTSPVVIPTLLALAKTFEPANAKRPAPPPYAYIVTTLFMHFCVFAISMSLTGIPVTDPKWVYANYIFQLFPLIFLPLSFLPTKPKTDAQTETPTLSASAFRVLKFLHFCSWWGTAIGFVATLRAGTAPFTAPVRFMALDFAGFVISFVGGYLIDLVAGDVPAGFGPGPLALRALATGPASTLAAYFEARERENIKFAADAGLKKGE
ncbi:hypothetical protein MKEN_00423800 [Mycena kentingensis (nom. inval.)]|nr:hypothetical protein MKEN_00423800 [Mycena kentingensis (nom. inval.)]